MASGTLYRVTTSLELFHLWQNSTEKQHVVDKHTLVRAPSLTPYGAHSTGQASYYTYHVAYSIDSYPLQSMGFSEGHGVLVEERPLTSSITDKQVLIRG